MIGRSIHQYQFIEKLGAGGMGEIYKAQDTRLNRIVAIKVLPASRSGEPERRQRFLQEAQAASGLNHPSIITIHDVLSEGDTEFMVMEYVAGQDAERCDSEGRAARPPGAEVRTADGGRAERRARCRNRAPRFEAGQRDGDRRRAWSRFWISAWRSSPTAAPVPSTTRRRPSPARR